MIEKRAAGILLPLFSLPSPEGRGCLDQNSFNFIDWLSASKQRYWQLLPLGLTYKHQNPYSACSSFGGDPAFISLQRLQEQHIISSFSIPSLATLSLNQLRSEKSKLILKHLLINFSDNSIQKFIVQHPWVKELATFIVLTEEQGADWRKWSSSSSRSISPTRIQEEIILQFLFFTQWKELQSYAHKKNIQIIGDLPIYIDLHSVDIWPNPHLFKLDAGHDLLFVSGAPPDQFSPTGQVWNTPVFNWDQHQLEHFSWWKKRIRRSLELFDLLRIDHFRGFASYWEIPNSSPPDARKGYWQKAKGEELFSTLSTAELNALIVEDLGDIDAAVYYLRDKFHFPGMNILQFAFETDLSNKYLPANTPTNSIYYTGTHDNDVITNWFEQSNLETKQKLKEWFHIKSSPELNWQLIELAYQARSNLVIIPFADIINAQQGRINTPGTISQNWQWQCSLTDFSPKTQQKLITLTTKYNRYE